MKKYLLIMIMITFNLMVNGQDKDIDKIKKNDVTSKKVKKTNDLNEPLLIEEKATRPVFARTRKTRKPDSMQPEYLSLQVGFAFSVYGTAGANVTLTYEKKIPDIPIAWFANYTYMNVGDEDQDRTYEYNPDRNYFQYIETTLEKIDINAHHFGGGFHYYYRDYDRKLKLYTGGGAYVGFNHHEKEFGNDGSIDGNGLDFGVYGILGIRWCRRHVKCGFEYRLGYINTKLFDENKSGATNELSFCLGVQF